MKEAGKELGHSVKFIKKYYKTERVFDEGYWDTTDLEYLKAIAVAKSKSKN
jgi:hypothetical protein